jgi:hypothetical protein
LQFFLATGWWRQAVAPGSLVAIGWRQLAGGGRQVADLDVVLEDYKLRG